MKKNRFFIKRYFSNFDIFDKIKDTNINKNETINETLKRKPSKKVLKIVDEILNLTLIEAADLCDLCREKLQGNKNFNNDNFINRNPFPHPLNFFNSNWNIPQHINPNFNNVNQQINVENIQTEKKEEKNKEKEKEKDKEKNIFNVKLEKFDPKNKINTIKEIRKITNVGLKEAKDMVESAPFYIQKNVPTDKANEMKKKFEEIGATIILE